MSVSYLEKVECVNTENVFAGRGEGEKAEKIRLLLLTMDERFPSPRGMELASQPGAVPTKVPCLFCNRRGRVQTKYKRWRYCPLCEGNVWRSARVGEEAFDPYVYEHDHAPFRLRTLGDVERLGGDIVLKPHVRTYLVPPRAHAYSWESSVSPWERSGSYAELRRCLDLMCQSEPLLSPYSVAGLKWLVRHWRGPCRVPRWERKYERQADPGEKHIRELARMGLKKARIARETGYSLRRVKSVLAS